MDATTVLAPHLPRLRRYAQTLTNSHTGADHYVRATLSSLLVEPTMMPKTLSPRAGLYAVFHRIWASVPRDDDDYLVDNSSTARAAVLLMVLESFSLQETSEILETPAMEILSDVLEVHRTLMCRSGTELAQPTPSTRKEWRADELRAA